MKKILGNFIDTPELKVLNELRLSNNSRFTERESFLSRQYKKLNDEAREGEKEFWNKAIPVLKALPGFPPDYTMERYAICFDDDLQVIMLVDAETYSREQLAKRLKDSPIGGMLNL